MPILLPDDAPMQNAWERCGIVLRTAAAALHVRTDGTPAVLGEQVTPNVLRSADGRHLAITERHAGRDGYMRLRLVDLVGAIEHTMPAAVMPAVSRLSSMKPGPCLPFGRYRRVRSVQSPLSRLAA
ncbi:hypothetical protein ACIBSW_12235 [Actinoplanes sp. NPDC049668]|uniref:hypothetical protein n=1 Tax=unclassified Actinoplanes TaxID=2626549 RepID=UPI0033A0A649